MNKDVEIALRALNNEFGIIKKALDPLSLEFKKINNLEFELKKLKVDIIPKLKKLELNQRRNLTFKPSGNTVKLELQYRTLENQLNKIKSELILLKKKPKTEKEKDEMVSLFENQKQLNNNLKKVDREIERQISKLSEEIMVLKKNPGIDKEQDVMLKELSQNQGMIKDRLNKTNKTFEEKYKKQITSNRKVIVNLISENNQMKHDLEKKEIELEKFRNEIKLFKNGFQERDKDLTKAMNIRKRHINQVVEELNESRKKTHAQGIIIAENKEKLDDMKIQLSKLKSNTSQLENSNKTKVDIKDIEDVKVLFNRLEKKNNSDIGEIKARMRELERKVVGKKDIEKMELTLQDIQTNQINKLKMEFLDLSKTMSLLPKHVEDKLSNLGRVMRYIDLLKKDIDRLTSRLENTETKFVDINKMKSGLELLDKKIGRISLPIDDMQNTLNYVEVVKKDHDRIKKDIILTEQRVDKISKNMVSTDLVKSVKEDVVQAISKAEKAQSLKNMIDDINQKLIKIDNKFGSELKNIGIEVDGLNIKVEKTSKMLRDLDKVL